MDVELAARTYVIVKGFIDAKDDRGRLFFGSILAVVSRHDARHLSVMFRTEELPRDIDWTDLLARHEENARADGRDAALVHNEEQLAQFLLSEGVLNGVAKNRNTKQAEQQISRYCTEQLHLKAVTFLTCQDAMESDVRYFDEAAEDVENDAQAEAEGEPESAPTTSSTAKNAEIVIRCEPILDPVGGVAMNELRTGDLVFGRLPADSVFYKLLSKNIPAFDGLVTARVTGLLVNELGTAVVTLDLADGVSGVMKFPGKVRVKRAVETDAERAESRRRFSLRSLPPETVFAGAVLLVAIAAVGVLYYIFW
jgi:hypothetical protein